MAVTIVDIAREARCSTATVSLALKNSNKIRLETREHVIKVANEMGYHPNFAARSLINGQTGMVGVIVPNLENPLFVELLRGVNECLTENGRLLVLGMAEQSRQREKEFMNMLSERCVDGLILFPTFLDENFPDFIQGKDERKIPLVLCGSSGLPDSNINYVKTDSRIGGYLATEHLIQCGCKRIAFIGAVVEARQAQSRINGYHDALDFYGQDRDAALEVLCSQNQEDIFRSTVNLLAHNKVDGIFCLYDHMALRVIRAVESMGLRIPEDVKIVSYDNINISSEISTTLTSVDTHSYKVGYKAAELLLKKINEPDYPNRQIVFKPELVVRESTTKKCVVEKPTNDEGEREA